MTILELERVVIERMFTELEGDMLMESAQFFRSVVVKERTFTGKGFITDFEEDDSVKVVGDGVSLRWGNVGARLNASKIDTGYVVYVDRGLVTGVEGYTYVEAWPERIEAIEIYDMEGAPLASRSTV